MSAASDTGAKFKIAYLAHAFPLPEEHYFGAEVEHLRNKDVEVTVYAAFSTRSRPPQLQSLVDETIYLCPLRIPALLRAALACLTRWRKLGDLYRRVLWAGDESLARRAKGVLHTWMGVYLAELMKKQQIVHIHAHHGYLASWLALVAARMLDISYSMTLHGSDLLIDRVYLDKKIEEASFCCTVSDYNKRFLLQRYPGTDPAKVEVIRMGVDCAVAAQLDPVQNRGGLLLLTVGRLAPVKDHRFLLAACEELKRRGHALLCLIAGEGEERKQLESLVRERGLANEVKFLGFVERSFLSYFYRTADLFVLTSKSEGIPMVLMEAMLHGTLVLAPDITGIPEIVAHGETGFLYRGGSVASFVEQVLYIKERRGSLGWLRQKARDRVRQEFDRARNTEKFAQILLTRLAHCRRERGGHHADTVGQ